MSSSRVDRAPAKQAPVAETEPVELLLVARVKRCDISIEPSRIDERGSDLVEGPEERAGEPPRAGRPSEPVEVSASDRTSDDERPLHIASDGTQAARDRREDVVEGADAPGQQSLSTPKQVPLDTLDVGAVRNYEPRIAVERIEIAVEEQSDLAGMCRPHDERERHSPIVVLASDTSSYARTSTLRKERGNRRCLRGHHGLRPSPAPSDRVTRHTAGTVVTEIRLPRTAACVREVDAHDCAFSFSHFLAAAVAHENRLSGHDFLLSSVLARGKPRES